MKGFVFVADIAGIRQRWLRVADISGLEVSGPYWETYAVKFSNDGWLSITKESFERVKASLIAMEPQSE